MSLRAVGETPKFLAAASSPMERVCLSIISRMRLRNGVWSGCRQSNAAMTRTSGRRKASAVDRIPASRAQAPMLASSLMIIADRWWLSIMSSSLSSGTGHTDLEQYFKETQTTALHMIEREDYALALDQLDRNERVLEDAKERSQDLDPDFVLVTLHNSACCHQALGRLEDSASYLEACLFNLKHALKSRETCKNSDNERYKLRKYESRARIQLCAMLSQLGRHEAALNHAEIGLRLAQALLLDVLMLCKAHVNRHRKLINQAKQTPDLARKLDSSMYKKHQDMVKKVLPLLEVLEARILSKPRQGGTPVKLELRSALGVQHYSDWIYTYNMSELMRVQPLTLYELKNTLETYAELGRDMMLDKVCLLVAGYFCTATELRLLTNEDEKVQRKEAQNLHAKALQVARDALPLEAPLLGHVQVSYQKHFTGLELSRTSRLAKLETSARAKLMILSATMKPRSSSAKAVRNTPRPAKPKSPAPTSTRVKRRPPEKPAPAPAPLTDRGAVSNRSPFRKSATPVRPSKRTDDTWASDSSDEFILSSADLYGPDDQHPRSSRHIECSIDIRDSSDLGKNDYEGSTAKRKAS